MLLKAAVAILALGTAPFAAAQDPYPITGVSVNQGAGVPLRQNINDLQNAGGAQWYGQPGGRLVKLPLESTDPVIGISTFARSRRCRQQTPGTLCHISRLKVRST